MPDLILKCRKDVFMNVDNLIPAIKNGTVTEETINLKVQHILQTLIAYGMLDKEQKDSNIAQDNPFFPPGCFRTGTRRCSLTEE